MATIKVSKRNFSAPRGSMGNHPIHGIYDTPQHLTLSNRILIEHERCKGSSCQDIAQMLKVHRTTIARELRRNSLPNGRYDHQLAQLRAQRRRTVASSQPRPKTAELWDEFVQTLRQHPRKEPQNSIMDARFKLRVESA